MCLGMPGQVVALDPTTDQLAEVDVGGARRRINVGMLSEPVRPGDWVLIHLGFAMDLMDEDEVRTALEGLRFLADESRE